MILQRLKEEEGFVVPFVALLIPVFIALLGLMVDVGVASSNYFKLANAVDAAAFAALDSYDEEAWQDDDRIEIDYQTARALADRYLHENLENATLVDFQVISAGRGVRVEAKVISPVFFMKMFGIGDREMSSFAEAELKEP